MSESHESRQKTLTLTERLVSNRVGLWRQTPPGPLRDAYRRKALLGFKELWLARAAISVGSHAHVLATIGGPWTPLDTVSVRRLRILAYLNPTWKFQKDQDGQ